jgi:hypothetical protein
MTAVSRGFPFNARSARAVIIVLLAAGIGGVAASITAARAEPPMLQLRPVAPGWIAIDWQHSDDRADGITLQRENPGFTWNFVVMSNTFVDMGLQAAHSYRYRACADYGPTQECTQWIATQTMAEPPPAATPGVPYFTSASAGPDKITVSWGSSENYGVYQVRWAENGHGDVPAEVNGQSFTATGLQPGTYHFIVEGCHDTILFGKNCSAFSAPIEIAIRVPTPPAPPPPPLPNDFIYSVTPGNDLMWYRHEGRLDGTFRWAFANGKKVGSGWDFKEVFSGGDGIIYGVTPVVPGLSSVTDLKGSPSGGEKGGDLLWALHVGRQDGSFRWTGPKKVGSGWGSFRHVFSAGSGIIYAITPIVPGTRATGIGPGMGGRPASGGDLMWYRHLGYADGSFRWEGPKKVGSGWGTQQTVFSGDDGVIYAITPVVPASGITGIGPGTGGSPASGGDLMWYRHIGRWDGTERWEGPKKIGSGWGAFQTVFSGGGGVIYGVLENGDLMWFRHDGHDNGSPSWAFSGVGKKVGTGWSKLGARQVFGD